MPDREILNRRIFHVAREVLFAAFTNPEHLKHWWGPKGFTNTIHAFDLRPGGVWRLTMHGPDGASYENEKIFHEIVEPERVVLRHPDPEHGFTLSATYVDLGEKTELTWRMRFESEDEYQKVKGIVSEANEENFDRLESYLRTHVVK